MKDSTKDSIKKVLTFINKSRLAQLLIITILIFAGLIFVAWFVPALRGVATVPFSIDLAIPLTEVELQIRWYTILVLIGLMSAVLVVIVLQALYEPLQEIDLWEATMFALLPGILLGRIYYVLTTPSVLQDNPWAWFQVGAGGLSIVGGIVGGIIGLWFFARIRLLDVKLLYAVAAVSLPLAQSIGRWGNFFNLELLGQPTALPWGLYVEPLFRPAGYEQSTYFHPIFLYESVASLALFLLMIGLWNKFSKKESGFNLKKAIKTGFFVKIYIAWYFCIRFWLDFLRIDGSIRPSGLTITQWLVLAGFAFIIIFSFIFQLWFRYKFGVWFTKHEQLERVNK